MTSEIHHRLDFLFSNFEWYRRWCGGHWEQWYIGPIHDYVWLNRIDCHVNIGRPLAAHGTPVCEGYRKRTPIFLGIFG